MKPTAAHGWPFEYDPIPLAPNETHVIPPTSKGRRIQMTLNQLAIEINNTAHEKGWYENGERNLGEVIALMHSELSEALEEYRNGHPVKEVYIINEKPEGVAIEMIDCIIRILDTLHENGVDCEAAIRLKMAYNKTRPYRHGGKKA